tara:strand:+ start:977 stop:1960 length:984 start_codon:yes stop_codon:yes gene_type:complete
MAEQSDKWHHTMCRYLGLDLDTFFDFGILPGVCREALGRNDYLYSKSSTFNSNKVYAWSDFHYRRLVKQNRGVTPYYGTSPFLWELGKIATENDYKPEGSLFFLPRDDQVTIRDDEYENVQRLIDILPRPVTFLLPWRTCDIWKHWDKLELGTSRTEFVQMSDPVTRQSTLSRLLLQHEHVYIPWPGTDIYYAEFVNKKIHIYDSIKQYRTKKSNEVERFTPHILLFLKWGYDYLNDVQKDYFHWTEKWNDIEQDIRNYLTIKMLGLDALKSPAELHEDLINNKFLQYNQKFVYNPDYQRSYEWLVSKTQEKTPHHSYHDHPHISLL